MYQHDTTIITKPKAREKKKGEVLKPFTFSFAKTKTKCWILELIAWIFKGEKSSTYPYAVFGVFGDGDFSLNRLIYMGKNFC